MGDPCRLARDCQRPGWVCAFVPLDGIGTFDLEGRSAYRCIPACGQCAARLVCPRGGYEKETPCVPQP